MATIAFVLLVAALLLFIVSTKQWALLTRGGVWAAGLALLLIAAGLTLADKSHGGGLLQAFGDLAAHWYAPSQSVLAQSLARNGPYIGRFVLPLLDLFLILGLIVGIVALIAFTPGDALEKFIRPIMIGLVGAILGGVVALGIVGTGFGEVAQQSVYSIYIKRDDVANGDTLWIGQASVRLRGIDAPEMGQVCRLGTQKQDCGAAAQRHLQDIVAGALVTCFAERQNRRSDDAYSRPLVTCRAARRGEQTFDIAQRMVADGYAVEYQGRPGDYETDVRHAMADNVGLLPSCTLRPDVWAHLSDAQRTAFADRGVIPARSAIMGHCPPPPRPSRPSGAPVYAPE
ncbi:MAG: thermonuclease family protein [Hyphomonadaceae bacterium]